ncbi:hypothetical protein PMAYCL1PPCAC_07516, partial [Pristionchus mayeri]
AKMSRRVAPHHFPPAMPIPIKKETAHSITIANRKAEVLQKKNETLSLTQANESKKMAIQDIRAESSALKRVVQQLTVENEKLRAHALNHPHASASHPQLQQKIKQLEEQLGRIHFEKNEMETKLHAENQARVQLITKLSNVNEANQSLTQEMQELKQRHAMDDDAKKKVYELNQELQRRIEFLCHENDILKNEQNTFTNFNELERALDQSKMNYDSLNKEKNRLTIELNIVHEKEAKMRSELEKAEWMNKVVSDQLEFCKKNSELWQEQTRVLSEQLRMTTGTVGLMQQQSCFVPTPFVQQSPTVPNCVSMYPTLSSRLGNSRTSSTVASDVIVLDEDPRIKRIKREDAH